MALLRNSKLRYSDIFCTARKNARTRGIPFELTKDDFNALLAEANGRCVLSGIIFNTDRFGSKRPFAPSLDRIDTREGYTKNNCRIVCVIANLAMNDWGFDAMMFFANMLVGYQNRKQPPHIRFTAPDPATVVAPTPFL